MDLEGVGSFLESIMAVMVVITASSVFMVVLGSSSLQVEVEIEEDVILNWLSTNGLYSEHDPVDLDRPDLGLDGLELPEGMGGISLVYRLSGNPDPLLEFGRGKATERDLTAIQRPLLIELGGRCVPGVLEVLAWR